MGTDWLADAVLYQIYPQSFADADGDGIGDLRGVIERLDHLSWLGVDTIWFNPCFVSPFVDAGYDVADYLQIAPRYGSNEDMVELIAAAKERGIRVLLDLVAGHTSDQHPWFQRELAASGPDPAGDRYVWCDEPPYRDTAGDIPGTAAWVKSPGPRPGWYLKNFYDAQPALNFGWARLPAVEPWRDPMDAAGPRRNRRALCDVLAFWLDRGAAGFRVDMAFSLVKDDPGGVGTAALWREIRTWLDEAYPDAVLVPEGTEPRTGGPLAFHADFFLVIHPEHGSLFDNRSAGVLPFHPPERTFFDADAGGSTRTFLTGWTGAREADPARPVLMATADHDFDRLCCGPRTAEQLGAALTFLLTWGTVPCIYYGDEIGMRYLPGMPDVEGAVCNPAYNRAGCRTPMQWNDGPNAGFSSADPSRLYLPIDPDPARPTVAAQRADPSSTLHLVRELIALRRMRPALGGWATTRVLHEGYPFAYVRGESYLVVVNPGREPAALAVPEARNAGPVLASGVTVLGDVIGVEGFGYGVLELAAVG
jgi:maltose alpha-D-glucosyltransferase/alpha-amylase